MDNQATGSNQPSGHVSVQIERLETLTTGLQRTYDRISERLLTITTLEEAPLNETHPEEDIVPLAFFIRDMNNRLSELNGRLLKLIDRIEL